MNQQERIERILKAVAERRPDCREVVKAELQAAVDEEREAIIELGRVLQKGTRGGFAEEIIDEMISSIQARDGKAK